MYTDETFKLSSKLQELKDIYERTSKRRKKLVQEMNLADQKIEKIEQEINSNAQTHIEEIFNKEKRSKIFKANIKQFAIKEAIALVILSIISLIIGNFRSFLFSLFFTSIFYIIQHTVMYRKDTKSMPKYKPIDKHEIEKLKKTHKKALEKRIELGSKYKSYWEAEKKAHNVYITMKELFTEKINYLESLRLEEYKQDDATYMNDIYYKIKMNPQGYFQSSNTRKEFLDEALNKYFKEKLAENHYNIVKSGKLDKLTTEELFSVLANYIPKEKHNKILNHVIHAILGYAGNMQSYSIVWTEENDDRLIDKPEIIFDNEGRWSELKTHKNTDYSTIFNAVYSAFLDKFMIEEKHKSKVRI